MKLFCGSQYYVLHFYMEFMAWFSHKYTHGFLWVLHKISKKDHKSWFERNDLFFIFYGVSTSCVIGWGNTIFGQDCPSELVFLFTV